MVKIFVIPEFGSSGSGTRSYFKILMRFYCSHQFEVVVGLTKTQLDSEIVTLLNNLGFRYVLIPERKASFKGIGYRFPFSVFFDLYSTVKIILREKPDLIVVSAGTYGLFLGLIAFPVRFLYVLHGDPGDYAQSVVKKIKKHILSSFLHEKKIILTVSEFTKKRLLASEVCSAKANWVKVIHNTVGSNQPVYLQDTDFKHQTIRVLTLGSVIWYKNPETWIAVARKVLENPIAKDVQFQWAGDGDLLENCRDAVVQLGLDQRIRFLSYRSDVDVLYSYSHIYFQPSLIENCPLSVVDAMRFGLPCVVSDVGGLPELVVNGETGFVVSVDSAQTMADKIITLASNERLRNGMGRAGCDRYMRCFSYVIWEKQMVDVHNILLNNLSNAPHS